MAIAEIKWKLVKDTYFFDTTTCYLSENGNHLFYVGKEKRIEILINDFNELVRKGCAVWLELGEHEFGLDKLSKCPTTTWYGIHQMLYSLEPWGVMKESKESVRKSIKESSDESYLDEVRGFYFSNLDVGEECEVQFADFVMPCRISQFYKDHRYVYLIAETIRGEELYFVITYAYIRNKFVLSKYFSSYGKAKNELLNEISSVL